MKNYLIRLYNYLHKVSSIIITIVSVLAVCLVGLYIYVVNALHSEFALNIKNITTALGFEDDVTSIFTGGLLLLFIVAAMPSIIKTIYDAFNPFSCKEEVVRKIILIALLGSMTVFAPTGIRKLKGVGKDGLPEYVKLLDPSVYDWYDADGIPKLYYSYEENGDIRYWNRIGVTPDTGMKISPVNSEIRKKFMLKLEESSFPEDAIEHDPKTVKWWKADGTPNLFYSVDNGKMRFWNRIGVTPDTGTNIVPITKDIRIQYEQEIERIKQEEIEKEEQRKLLEEENKKKIEREMELLKMERLEKERLEKLRIELEIKKEEKRKEEESQKITSDRHTRIRTNFKEILQKLSKKYGNNMYNKMVDTFNDIKFEGDIDIITDPLINQFDEMVYITLRDEYGIILGKDTEFFTSGQVRAFDSIRDTEVSFLITWIGLRAEKYETLVKKYNSLPPRIIKAEPVYDNTIHLKKSRHIQEIITELINSSNHKKTMREFYRNEEYITTDYILTIPSDFTLIDEIKIIAKNNSCFIVFGATLGFMRSNEEVIINNILKELHHSIPSDKKFDEYANTAKQILQSIITSHYKHIKKFSVALRNDFTGYTIRYNSSDIRNESSPKIFKPLFKFQR